MKSPEKRKLPILVVLATALTLVASLLMVVPANASSNPVMKVVPWPGSEANHASYWSDRLNTTCVKVDQSGPFKTSYKYIYDYVVTKGGQWNNIWYDIKPGTRITEVSRGDKQPAGISHYFLCGKHKKPPKPPKAELKVNLTCVPNRKGRDTRIRVDAGYVTYGRELRLIQNLTIETEYNGIKTINTENGVQGAGNVRTFKYAGPGTHYVHGWVKLVGHKTKVKKWVDEHVECDQPHIVQPKARILQPCGDPMAGGIFINAQSTRPVTFKLVISKFKYGNGVTLKKKTVAGGDRFFTRAYYVDSTKFNWIRIERGNGEILAIERLAEPGNYGWGSWECRVLKNRDYLN